MLRTGLVVVASLREWWLVLSHRKPPLVHEAPFGARAEPAGD